MNFDDLKPGPELDKLIAEKKMGYIVASHPWRSDTFVMASSQRAIEKARATGNFIKWDSEGDREFCRKLARYSTDISDAWRVIEHLKRKDFTVYLFDQLGYDTETEKGDLWRIGFMDDKAFEMNGEKPRHEVWLPIGEAETAPLAICIAALKALGE